MVGTLIRWTLRLLLTLLGVVFMLGMLAALVLYMAFALFRWILTGRKPQAAVVWQHYQGMRQRFTRDAASAQSDVIDVIDVEVREVREVRDDSVGREGPR